MSGMIFRVGHLGAVTVNEIVAALEILEEASAAAGLPLERGAAMQAAARAADRVAAGTTTRPVAAGS